MNRNLEQKICDRDFCELISGYDIIFLSECWILPGTSLKCDLLDNEFECKCFPRLKGKGGGLVVLYRKSLGKTVSIVKCIEDTLVWLKIEQRVHSDTYICFAYIPPDHNIYYTKYNSDLFDCIADDMSVFAQNGTVVIAGDLNSRVGSLPDYIEGDSLHL